MHQIRLRALLKKCLILLSLAGLCAFGLVATTSISHPAKAYASTCKFSTFSYYPTLAPSNFRYGEADFHFQICSGTDPSLWGISAEVHTNSTGYDTGYTFDNASIYPTSGGSYYRFYAGTFNIHACAPLAGWPCGYSGSFTVNFYAWVVNGSPGVIYMSDSSDVGQHGWWLATTP